MTQYCNLIESTCDQIRLLAPMWPKSALIEALRKIRATWKIYAGSMPEDQVLVLLRKEQIIINELWIRMKKKRVHKSNVHQMIEKIVGHNPHETALKI